VLFGSATKAPCDAPPTSGAPALPQPSPLPPDHPAALKGKSDGGIGGTGRLCVRLAVGGCAAPSGVPPNTPLPNAAAPQSVPPATAPPKPGNRGGAIGTGRGGSGVAGVACSSVALALARGGAAGLEEPPAGVLPKTSCSADGNDGQASGGWELRGAPAVSLSAAVADVPPFDVPFAMPGMAADVGAAACALAG